MLATQEEKDYQKEPTKNTLEWQVKLLPLMKWMIIFLTIFFFLASFAQLVYLQISINTAPKVDISQPLSLFRHADTSALEQRQNIARLESIILLEANTVERRHHQANVLLMSSIWVRYLGFVTGMILALIGAIFILGKLEGKNISEIAGKTTHVEASLKSSSPGVILVVLGSILMITTIAMQHTIQVNDASVYLQDSMHVPIKTDQKKPVLILPTENDTIGKSKN